MNPEQRAVLDFHKIFGSGIVEKPSIQDEALASLSIALIAEEFNEVIGAMAEQDPVALAKELADLLYVVYGAGIRAGIDLEPVFWEVHRSNLTKVPEDGIIQYREDGKILKPDTYSPADLKPIIEKQLGETE